MVKLITQMAFMTGLLTLSQIFLKKLLTGADFSQISMKMIIGLVVNIYTLGVIMSMGVAFVIWAKIIRQHEFSLAYPLVSISYFWALFAGHYVFNEPITALKVTGILLIGAGVVVSTLK